MAKKKVAEDVEVSQPAMPHSVALKAVECPDCGMPMSFSRPEEEIQTCACDNYRCEYYHVAYLAPVVVLTPA